MRKRILTALLMLIVAVVSASAKLATFCGVQMGMTKEQVRSILWDRFGDVQEDSGTLFIRNGQIGGIHFERMVFSFSWLSGHSRLNGAYFTSFYVSSRKQEAIQHRDVIKSVYEKKYSLEEYKTPEGFKGYYFGDSEWVYGKIEITKIQDKQGKVYYCPTLYYFGPYDEVDDI